MTLNAIQRGATTVSGITITLQRDLSAMQLGWVILAASAASVATPPPPLPGSP